MDAWLIVATNVFLCLTLLMISSSKGVEEDPSPSQPVEIGVVQPAIFAPEPIYARTSIQGGQIGTLTGNVNGVSAVLPLMGHESATRRSRWHYYTYTDSINKQPLSVWVNGRDCMQSLGCNEIFEGDTVRVAPYKDSFDTYLFR